MSIKLLNIFSPSFFAQKNTYILILFFIVSVLSQYSFADPKIRCTGIIFNGVIEPSTPLHLLLQKGWVSTRTQYKPFLKLGLSWAMSDYFNSEKIKYSFKEPNSLTNTIKVKPGLGAIPILDPTPEQIAFQRRNYRGGTPATAAERKARRNDLKQILDFSAGYTRLKYEIYDKHGAEIKRIIHKDILQETAERTINFLIAEGVLIEVFNNDLGFLSARILTEGIHKFNRRSLQIERDYEQTHLWYKISEIKGASYRPSTGDISIDENIILSLNPKNGILGHELRHAKNFIMGERKFGSAIADIKNILPGKPLAYKKFQVYEEGEMHSFTLRQEAQNLLELMLLNKLGEAEFFEYQLFNFAFSSSVIADRNTIITGILDRALREGTEPSISKEKTYWGGEDKNVATFKLNEPGHAFRYKMIIHDIEAKTQAQQIAFVRAQVNEMIRLNPNYVTQFKIAEQATELLLSVTTAREKAAVLEGIISITRPHFWDAGNFVVVKEADLIQKFNSVVSDRWLRFAHLP